MVKSTCSNRELVTKGANDLPQMAPKDTPSENWITQDAGRVLETFPF